MKPIFLPLISVAVLAGILPLQADVRFLAHGHTDLALDYDPVHDAWDFHVGSDTLGTEFGPGEVVLKVKPAAQTTVPNNAKFSFLGAVGDAVWILPQAQDEQLLYLGYGGDGIPNGVFTGNQVKVTLKSLTGPGQFSSYRVDAFGNPQVLFNTRDGITPADLATVQSGGDAHLAWAFAQPGDYTAVLEASGTLVAGGQPTSSGPVAFSFSVGSGPKVLDAGHADLAIAYSVDANAWDLHAGSDASGESYDADDVVLRVKGDAMTTVPAGDKFAFLGSAGDPVWILPQAQNEQLLCLGFGGDGIPHGVFTGDKVDVTLRGVTGPGDFFSYRVDAFGTPEVLFNTRDGITAADVATVRAGGDAHLNWAFTQPGDYTVVVEASATLVLGNTPVSSGPIAYTFSVLKPVVRLTDEHVDLRVLFDPSGTHVLGIVARDEDHHVNYATNETVLVVAESAKLALPPGTPFGPEGNPLWILPQSQQPDLLYLGLSAEGIAPGAFTGNLTFRLKAIDGPGQFFLWQASQFGGFDIQMNTTDGISAADSHVQIIGSHEHFNFGFTTNGLYHLTFDVSGRRAGDSEDIISPPETFTFEVLPLPSLPAALEIVQVAANGDLQIKVSGGAGATYNIQTSEELKAWTTLQSVTLAGTTVTVIVPAAGPTRFVRASAH